MSDDRSYARLDDTVASLLRALGPRSRSERVGVRVSYGRILSADVVAPRDSPPRDLSHFDGYAVRSSETAGASRDSPVRLSVARGSARAGAAETPSLRRGSAVRVATGGPLPPGADSVVPVEDAALDDGSLELSRPAARGDHVYPRAADVREGDVVLRTGRHVVAQDLVLLASLRVGSVMAYRMPVVSVLPTGSELTRSLRDTRPGKVFESHSLLLERLIMEAGGRPDVLPVVRDDRRALATAVRAALRRSDILLTLAGSSVGEPDLVDSTLRGFGKETSLLVHGLRVNRGRVMGVGVVAGKPVVILPGPVQGALNAFIVLVYPLVRHYLGMGWEEPPAVGVRMGEGWVAEGRFRDFDQVVYLKLVMDPEPPGGLLAFASGAESEKASFLTSKNAYALVPGERPELVKGEAVKAHLLPGFSRLQ